MRKRHPSGFVPVPFKSGGKVLLPISSFMSILGGMDYWTGWNVIPPAILFVGLGLLIVSIYLLFVVPKE